MEAQQRNQIKLFFIDSKGKILWYIKIVFHTIEFLLQRHISCPIYFQGDKPNQLDTKGLPPTQGHNPSLNSREAGSSLMKIGKGSWIFHNQNWQETCYHQKAGSSLNKVGKGRIQDLTGDVRLPEVDHLG